MNLGINLIFIRLFLSLFFGPNECYSERGTGTFLLPEANILYSNLAADDLSYETFLLAYQGYSTLLDRQFLDRDTILTIIDYSKPSDQERLFIFDLKNQKLLFRSLVAHGKGSGEKVARSFSNQPSSHMSSLGFFITGYPYNGKHGYSLRMDGIENGINNNALSRAIVFHEASYVSMHYIKKYGRLGRSFGCPALPAESNRSIIDAIKNSSCVFIYAPDECYFRTTNLVSSRLYSQTNAQ